MVSCFFFVPYTAADLAYGACCFRHQHLKACLLEPSNILAFQVNREVRHPVSDIKQIEVDRPAKIHIPNTLIHSLYMFVET